jgi:uncharacterized membrane protein YcaP (DUF421 family)
LHPRANGGGEKRQGGFVHLFDWHALYVNLLQLGTGETLVSAAEKIIRPIAVYLFLVFLLRQFGQRILAQLNPFDLVVLLTLSNTVQNAIIGNDTSLVGGVLGAAALIGVNAALVRLYYRGPRIEHQMLEDDIYLIRAHEIQEDALRQLHINVGELTARAHERGFDSIHDVRDAVLYPNGTIYMKGDAVNDAARHQALMNELQSLRQAIAGLSRAG